MASNANILLVEDDRGLRQAIVGALQDDGYAITAVPDGIQGAQSLRNQKYDLLLLDLGIPFVDGWEILEQLEGSLMPSVMVISARDDEADKVRALDLGADDYLTKPFGAEELLARVRAILRRMRATTKTAKVVTLGELTVDLGARGVMRDGQEIRLTPTEWALLSVLAENAGIVLDHRTLLSSVWGSDYVGDRNYLRTFVQRLRRKLEINPAEPEVIVTAGRQDYRFGPLMNR